MPETGYLETCCWRDPGDRRECVGEGCACGCHLERPRDLNGALEYMTLRGSSIVLTWGEDTEQWECAWIRDGLRFLGVGSTAYVAVRRALHRVRPDA